MKKSRGVARKLTGDRILSDTYYNIDVEAGFSGGRKLMQKFSTAKEKQRAQDWLKQQLAYSLHKNVRTNYATRKYQTGGVDDLWQADLLEMIPYASVNHDYKYILVVIDVFSRYAWAAPMRKNDANATTEASNSKTC